MVPAAASARDNVRIATFHTELQRDGPGLLLRDILDGEDAQVAAVIAVVAHAAPDILLLQGLDYDLDNHALTALAQALTDAGVTYPYLLAFRPNTGMPTGFDMDDNGYLGEARDAQGYGRYSGQGGMAILSRFPIDREAARDFSSFLWRDLPGALLPTRPDGSPFPSAQAQAVQRLSSVGHWEVPVVLPDGTRLHLLAFHATTPVFDGPEDRNGRRGHDEVAFWRLFLDDALPWPAPEDPVVVMGVTNIDPQDGDGRHQAYRDLVAHPRLTDPKPTSPGGAAAANVEHRGRPELDTADWTDPSPGNLRVDYILPDAGLRISGAGVIWPAPSDPFAKVTEQASRHRLVWVDLMLD